jgi:hypothetical protein
LARNNPTGPAPTIKTSVSSEIFAMVRSFKSMSIERAEADLLRHPTLQQF